MDASIDPARQPAPAAENAEACTGIETPGAPARARLATTIRDLAAAAAGLAAAQQPAVRLGAVIAEAARYEAELAAQRAADQERLGAWLVGGGEPRPVPDPATIAAEKRSAELAGDAVAARAALPAAEAVFGHCAERVREIQRRRDEAVCEAAVEAACDYADAYRVALTVASSGKRCCTGCVTSWRRAAIARMARPGRSMPRRGSAS